MTYITNCFDKCVFQFWKKKYEYLSFKYGHFTTISGNFFATYINISHKTEIQRVILRCLVCKNLNWIKSYNIILIKSCIFHAWKCIISGPCRASLPKWVLTPQMKPALVFSKWIFFQNYLRLSWDTKSCKTQV